jgi:hypothetical protein
MGWLRKILSGPDPDDILPGDWVKGPFKGAGVVEEVNGDPPHAIVAVGGLRHIMPAINLRRIKASIGWSLDVRR